MRQQLTSQKREELRRSRDHWKARAEDEERFQKMKEEAWRLFERQPGFKRKTREEFEEELTRKVRNTPGNNRGEREKMVQKWSSEMHRAVQLVERRERKWNRKIPTPKNNERERKYGDRGFPSQCRSSHQRNELDIELAALVSSAETASCPKSLRPVPRIA